MVWKGNVPPINETISIIGAGHLGKTLAQMLIECGFPKEKLMISYGGKISTFESIKKAGLIENFTVGVCLPAALLIANKKRLNVDHAIGVIEKEYTGFREIHVWAKKMFYLLLVLKKKRKNT
ncbi:NAD(P)-binding domain-containing protein [Methanosarcina horonobensis]|uniref:NAD(P)-binding domain-containing protein n=1 Tax=Methanosarcina horonobensis TaxID=418008 RepID=UPI000A92AC86|nr:NAD(P)-binding domain-containing protein [Methanosarcina horonobensis]